MICEVLKSLFLLLTATIACGDTSSAISRVRDSSYLKLMIIPPPAEPYSYPGPSPPAPLPSRHSPARPDRYQFRPSEPYSFIPPYQMRPGQVFDVQMMPRWCQQMWEREECGMKCWMLRKICKNMAQQSPYQPVDDLSRPDFEGSHTMHHTQYNPYPYYPKPAVAYSRTGVPNTFYAHPSWSYAPVRKNPFYHLHRYYAPINNEIGLNPQFTYVDGNEKLKTRSTTEVPVEDPRNATESSETMKSTTVTTPLTSMSKPEIPTSTVRIKGKYPVKVKNSFKAPVDEADVTTLSPLMFEYDQYGTKGYYGDRVYLSAVLPVSNRKIRSQEPDQKLQLQIPE